MNGLTPELVERIYAEASDALSNEEMYTRVQEHTGMTNEQLQEMKTFGTGKTRTSAVKTNCAGFSRLCGRPVSLKKSPERGRSGSMQKKPVRICTKHETMFG